VGSGSLDPRELIPETRFVRHPCERSCLDTRTEPGQPPTGMRSVEELDRIARELRIDILKMIARAGSGHPGGSLSCVEIITALYFAVMTYRTDDPRWPGRDRFVLSKGHGVPTVYAALARAGCIDGSELDTLRRFGSRLQGHPDHLRLPFIEVATGSLGQGLSVAVGLALAQRLDSRNDYRVYCLLGDGEIQAGQVWEAVMAGGKFRLGTLTAILDSNKVQLDGHVRNIMEVEPVAEKWRAFGWHASEIDGHDTRALLSAFDEARSKTDRPSVIIASTVKGKGVSFMEDTYAWHGKAPGADELERALAELGVLAS
jgi:transketolase